MPKKITLKSKKVDKAGGGHRWINKAVNVITLTLMAVDKDTGGCPAVDKKNLNVITLTLMAVDKRGGGGKPLSTKGG